MVVYVDDYQWDWVVHNSGFLSTVDRVHDSEKVYSVTPCSDNGDRVFVISGWWVIICVDKVNKIPKNL